MDNILIKELLCKEILRTELVMQGFHQMRSYEMMGWNLSFIHAMPRKDNARMSSGLFTPFIGPLEVHLLTADFTVESLSKG